MYEVKSLGKLMESEAASSVSLQSEFGFEIEWQRALEGRRDGF